jgi:hypothetical protein
MRHRCACVPPQVGPTLENPRLVIGSAELAELVSIEWFKQQQHKAVSELVVGLFNAEKRAYAGVIFESYGHYLCRGAGVRLCLKELARPSADEPGDKRRATTQLLRGAAEVAHGASGTTGYAVHSYARTEDRDLDMQDVDDDETAGPGQEELEDTYTMSHHEEAALAKCRDNVAIRAVGVPAVAAPSQQPLIHATQALSLSPGGPRGDGRSRAAHDGPGQPDHQPQPAAEGRGMQGGLLLDIQAAHFEWYSRDLDWAQLEPNTYVRAAAHPQ